MINGSARHFQKTQQSKDNNTMSTPKRIGTKEIKYTSRKSIGCAFDDLILDKDGNTIARTFPDRNNALLTGKIIRSLNNYDELVEALEVVVARVRLEKEENPGKRIMLGAVVEEFAALLKRAKAE